VARIRSVKPEFFTSKTLAQLDYRTRLTFIGLWTHADDGGRCEDDATLIRAALWVREQDLTDFDVECDLRNLATHGLIDRYDGEFRGAVRPLLQVNGWSEHQRINNPTKSRIPAPLPEDSRRTHVGLPEDSRTGAVELGTGEQGNRGKNSSPTADALAGAIAGFDEFWATYPRRDDKGAARKAWAKAIKKADPGDINIAAASYRDDPNRLGEFTKYPATWLNAEGWSNGPLPARVAATAASEWPDVPLAEVMRA